MATHPVCLMHTQCTCKLLLRNIIDKGIKQYHCTFSWVNTTEETLIHSGRESLKIIKMYQR